MREALVVYWLRDCGAALWWRRVLLGWRAGSAAQAPPLRSVPAGPAAPGRRSPRLPAGPLRLSPPHPAGPPPSSPPRRASRPQGCAASDQGCCSCKPGSLHQRANGSPVTKIFGFLCKPTPIKKDEIFLKLEVVQPSGDRGVTTTN